MHMLTLGRVPRRVSGNAIQNERKPFGVARKVVDRQKKFLDDKFSPIRKALDKKSSVRQ